MGTQGTIRVYEGDTEILRFSASSDGYPEGLGREVADFCATKRIVNGISSRHRMAAIANGAGCLAAQLVAHFKEEVGSFYVVAPGGDEPRYGYEYIVRCPDFKALERAIEKAGRDFDGLPIVVEGFHIEDDGKTRITIPDGQASPSEGDDG